MKNIIKNKYILASFVLLTVMLYSCFDRDFEKEDYIIEYPAITITDFNPKTARPTAEVTIEGTNFLGVKDGASVSFGGVSIDQDDILSYSENQIVVKVPEGSVSGELVVRVYTQTAVAADAFTYLEGAVVNDLAPATAEFGETITIYGERFGTNKESVQFIFYEDVEAEVVSVSDTEIIVTVPEGIRSGNPTLIVDGQKIECPKFNIPVIGAKFAFDTDGDAEGWMADDADGATYEVSNGKFNVTYGSAQGADFELSEDIKVLAAEFPILAIRIDGAPYGDNAEFTFETELGKYQNISNNWDGKMNDDVFYYDLRKSFEFGQTIDPDVASALSTFKWTISGADGAQTGYSVDWVKSFQSVDDLRNLVKEETPAGYYVFEFDDENQTEWAVGDKNYNYQAIENGKLIVPVDDNSTYWVSRFTYTPFSGEKFVYSSEYPIFAFKLKIFDTQGNDIGYLPWEKTATTKRNNIKFRNTNNRGPKDTYAEEYDGVLYWDFPNANLGGNAPVEGENDSWYIRIPSSLGHPYQDSDPTHIPHGHIEVDWIRTFKNTGELEAFLETQK
ncbi:MULTISPECIES: DUF4979 domain-containing protein [unclassified Saccharicrinis]|uniref:DUF4979 domain-containing protein n=1 Tax=unclassified Saccharicrinis TaxID=2646859 RepID=UPI003D3437DF